MGLNFRGKAQHTQPIGASIIYIAFYVQALTYFQPIKDIWQERVCSPGRLIIYESCTI